MTASLQASLSSCTTGDGTVVLALDGELDATSTPKIGASVIDALGSPGDVVIDLRGVTFIDSRMLPLLLVVTRQAEARGHNVVLIRPNPRVWRACEISGLGRLFESCADLKEALGRPRSDEATRAASESAVREGNRR